MSLIFLQSCRDSFSLSDSYTVHSIYGSTTARFFGGKESSRLYNFFRFFYSTLVSIGFTYVLLYLIFLFTIVLLSLILLLHLRIKAQLNFLSLQQYIQCSLYCRLLEYNKVSGFSPSGLFSLQFLRSKLP